MHANTTAHLPAGTQVLNTTDGESGSILNGYAVKNGEWTEYEVETAYGIEVWKVRDFIRFDDMTAE